MPSPSNCSWKCNAQQSQTFKWASALYLKYTTAQTSVSLPLQTQKISFTSILLAATFTHWLQIHVMSWWATYQFHDQVRAMKKTFFEASRLLSVHLSNYHHTWWRIPNTSDYRGIETSGIDTEPKRGIDIKRGYMGYFCFFASLKSTDWWP